MNLLKYEDSIKKFKIKKFGFDTQHRALRDVGGFEVKPGEIKSLWNDLTNNTFKRIPRTEFWFEECPELSTPSCPMYRFRCPNGYIKFHFTQTAVLLVPDGYLTDKGSIPKILQGIFSIHDKEMQIGYIFHDVECDMQRMSRLMCDGLLLEVGKEIGASWLKRNLIYLAVRAGNRFTKKDKVINDFNVSEFNRDLVHKADCDYDALCGKVNTSLVFNK